MNVNQWEEKLFDQSRLIEPKDGPVKTAVSIGAMFNNYYNIYFLYSHANLILISVLPKNPKLQLLICSTVGLDSNKQHCRTQQL